MEYAKLNAFYYKYKHLYLDELKKNIIEEYEKACDLLTENPTSIIFSKNIISFYLKDIYKYIIKGINSTDIKNILNYKYNIPINRCICEYYIYNEGKLTLQDINDFECNIINNSNNENNNEYNNEGYLIKITITI